MFHPRGITCAGVAEPLQETNDVQLARELSGPVLIRLSSAWWKAREWTDVLGCAIRFGESAYDAVAEPGDQDLLFATIRRPWTMAFSPFATDRRDFLSNRYYAVSPFVAGRLGRVEWRLSPEQSAPAAANRAQRLDAALSERSASFLLEWTRYRRPWRVWDEGSFRPLLRIRLNRRIEVDQEALRFDPFRTGRGVVPVGFIHALRRATYAASQAARPRQDSARI